MTGGGRSVRACSGRAATNGLARRRGVVADPHGDPRRAGRGRFGRAGDETAASAVAATTAMHGQAVGSASGSPFSSVARRCTAGTRTVGLATPSTALSRHNRHNRLSDHDSATKSASDRQILRISSPNAHLVPIAVPSSERVRRCVDCRERVRSNATPRPRRRTEIGNRRSPCVHRAPPVRTPGVPSVRVVEAELLCLDPREGPTVKSNSMIRPIGLSALALTFALGLSACGASNESDDSSTQPTAATPRRARPCPATSTAPAPPPRKPRWPPGRPASRPPTPT